MAARYYYKPYDKGVDMDADRTVPFSGREIPAGSLLGFANGEQPDDPEFARVSRKNVDKAFGYNLGGCMAYTVREEGKMRWWGPYVDRENVEGPSGVLVPTR